MRHALIGLAGIALVGCGSIPPTIASGDTFSTEHHQQRFSDAAKGAAEYCATRGKAAKHIGTEAAFGPAISRFECVPR